MFRYPIPADTKVEWKSRVAVVSHAAITLAITTARVMLAHLESPDSTTPPSDHLGQILGGKESILFLAMDLQNILGEALDTAVTKFPQ